MKNVFFSLMCVAALLLTACGNKAQKSLVDDYGDMLGLWVLQEPQRDAKWEMMFNEDSTGFVFVADTFHCSFSWLPNDDVIDVKYLYNNGGVKYTIANKFKHALDADTLILQEIGEGGAELVKNRYLRFKQ